MLTEKEKWLQFRDGQYQFKVPFMLYADFESILKPVDEPYRNNVDRMKPGRKGKASYTEKINIHVPSKWCVLSNFAYGDVLEPLKMYRGKDCVERFVVYIEEEVKHLYETSQRQPMTKFTDVLKREHEAAEKCYICLREFNDLMKNKMRDHCHYTGLYQGVAHNNCNLKYQIPGHIPIVFHSLSGYDAHLFIKELGRGLIKRILGSFQRARRNTSVLMLISTSIWLVLSIKTVQKCVKIFSLGLYTAREAIYVVQVGLSVISAKAI